MNSWGYPDAAVVVLLGRNQFGPGEHVIHPQVGSRKLNWCISGTGTVVTASRTFTVRPDDYMVLPWGHSAEYLADSRNPFLLGSLHLIPVHDRDHPVIFHVPHHAGDLFADVPWRRDAPMPGYEGVVTGSFLRDSSLGHLAEYLVTRLLREGTEALAREMAALLIHELAVAVERRRTSGDHLPSQMQRMLRFVSGHLRQGITLDDVAEGFELSRSTVGRMFRRHMWCSAGEWIAKERIAKAQYLLRTTKLTIAEVGVRVGISDPYYFSKLFKKHSKMSPLEYRKSRHLA